MRTKTTEEVVLSSKRMQLGFAGRFGLIQNGRKREREMELVTEDSFCDDCRFLMPRGS